MSNEDESRVHVPDGWLPLGVGERRLGGSGCVVELAARLAGEDGLSAPRDACPLVVAFLRTLNDGLDDDARQRLVPYAGRIAGTRSTPERDAERLGAAAGWLASGFAAEWLRAAGLERPAADFARAPVLPTADAAAGMHARANEADRILRERLAALGPQELTDASAAADRATGLCGGAAAAELCRVTALPLDDPRLAGPAFAIGWRGWSTGWLAANLAAAPGADPEAAAAATARLRESVFGLLDRLVPP